MRLRTLPGAAFLFAWALAAQVPPPSLVRGELLDCEITPSGTGAFSVRIATHQVFRFTFDAKTYIERDSRREAASGLEKGDLVEVVADSASEPLLRYARTVHVVDRRPPRPQTAQRLFRSYRTSLDRIVPMGDLTFAGIVARVNGERLLLRTRKDGEKSILLREDTRYLEDGRQVAAGELKANTCIFVRGARNFEDEIEAYQVVWGRILDPAAGR